MVTGERMTGRLFYRSVYAMGGPMERMRGCPIQS